MRERLLTAETADWLLFTREQRLWQIAARDGAPIVAAAGGNSPIEKLFASLSTGQVSLLREYSLRLDGLRCVLDPDMQRQLGVSAAQAARLRQVLQPLPPNPVRVLGGVAHNPSKPMAVRLKALDQEMDTLVQGVANRHDAEEREYRRLLQVLTSSQASRLRQFLSLAQMNPDALNRATYQFLASPWVQQTIGMSTKERERYYEAVRHPIREPGDGRIIDLWAPTRQAIARLLTGQRQRLRQITIQLRASLITSREVSRELGLTCEQLSQLDFENEVGGYRHSFDFERSSILHGNPGNSIPGATTAQLQKASADEAAVMAKEMSDSELAFKSHQTATIRKILTAHQWATWLKILGKPFTAPSHP